METSGIHLLTIFGSLMLTSHNNAAMNVQLKFPKFWNIFCLLAMAEEREKKRERKRYSKTIIVYSYEYGLVFQNILSDFSGFYLSLYVYNLYLFTCVFVCVYVYVRMYISICGCVVCLRVHFVQPQ